MPSLNKDGDVMESTIPRRISFLLSLATVLLNQN